MLAAAFLLAQSDSAELIGLCCSSFLLFLPTACIWVLYEKAGEPGWAAIVPFYNTIVALRIGNRPEWYFWMLLIPIVNIYFAVSMIVGFVEAYDFHGLFALGVIFLPWVFLPIMAFTASNPGTRKRRQKKKRRAVRRRRPVDLADEWDTPRKKASRPRRPGQRPRRRPSWDEYDDDEEF